VTIIELSPEVAGYMPGIMGFLVAGAGWGVAKYTQYSTRREREAEARAAEVAEPAE